jgi:TetR/AcrR family transcriptional regulator, transcriptional repressor of aconitase
MPKIIDHDAYRQELVHQATQLFTKQGYAALGMREIATALGISKSALYHYFPSKEALFNAVVAAVMQLDFAAFAAYHPAHDTFQERLRTVLRYCADQEAWFTQHFLVLTDYVRGKSAEEIQAEGTLPAATATYITFLQDYLGLDRVATIGLLAFINGLILQRLFDGQATSFQHTADWLVAMYSHFYPNR